MSRNPRQDSTALAKTIFTKCITADTADARYGKSYLWLLLHPDVGNFAKVLFGVLDAKYADRHTRQCRPFRPPSRRELAETLSVTINTIDAALGQLEAVGALSIQARHHRGDRIANLYTLHYQPLPTSERTTGTHGRQVPRKIGAPYPEKLGHRCPKKLGRSKEPESVPASIQNPPNPPARGAVPKTAAERGKHRRPPRRRQLRPSDIARSYTADEQAAISEQRHQQAEATEQVRRQAEAAIARMAVGTRTALYQLAAADIDRTQYPLMTDDDYRKTVFRSMTMLLVERSKGIGLHAAIAQLAPSGTPTVPEKARHVA